MFSTKSVSPASGIFWTPSQSPAPKVVNIYECFPQLGVHTNSILRWTKINEVMYIIVKIFLSMLGEAIQSSVLSCLRIQYNSFEMCDLIRYGTLHLLFQLSDDELSDS
jgi:hypothetical protein